MVEAFGDEARDTHAVFFRRWGVDPFTLGYITGWRPGDVMSVGPLHGTHEPPFYVCGSDQWVAGYMEGAVRTGRGAAAAAARSLTLDKYMHAPRFCHGQSAPSGAIVVYASSFPGGSNQT